MKKTYTRKKKRWFWITIRLLLFCPVALLIAIAAVVSTIHDWLQQFIPAGTKEEEIPFNSMTREEILSYQKNSKYPIKKGQVPIYELQQQDIGNGKYMYTFKKLKDK